MKPSRLVSIIRRLEAMMEDKTEQLQVRRFEIDGAERAQVTYDHDRNVFILNDLTSGLLVYDSVLIRIEST